MGDGFPAKSSMLVACNTQHLQHDHRVIYSRVTPTEIPLAIVTTPLSAFLGDSDSQNKHFLVLHSLGRVDLNSMWYGGRVHDIHTFAINDVVMICFSKCQNTI